MSDFLDATGVSRKWQDIKKYFSYSNGTKTTPVDADCILMTDSADTESANGTTINKIKRVTLANLKAAINPSGDSTPDTPPSTPSSYDDEFNDATITGWTDYNFASGTKVESDGCLQLKTSNDALSQQGVVKASPTGNFELTAKLVGGAKLTASHRYGIVIAESITGKNFVFSFIAQAANYGHMLYEAMNSPTSRISYALNSTPADFMNNQIYLKAHIYNDAGTWKAELSYSTNGYKYYVFVTGVTIGFTPAYIGLIINNEGGASLDYAWFDWFRVTE